MPAVDVPIPEHADTYHTFALDGRLYPSEELPLSRAVLNRETVMNAQLLIRRSDGVELVLEASATPVLADDGTQLGAVATFRDVTVQWNLERQKEDFLAAAAHDLRTPLTTIRGMAQVLQRRAVRSGYADARGLLEGLERIDATTGKMSSLINRLLDLTRLQMNQPLDLQRRPVDLVQLVRATVEEHEPSAPTHHISVEVTAGGIVGNWDAFRVERVIANLLSNATKYSPEAELIVVEVREEEDDAGRWACVRIRDEGVGIPEEALPYIFDRFYRASNVIDTIPGVGIGLAGARQIVEQHGGSIEVESVEGGGATFTVRLPLAP